MNYRKGRLAQKGLSSLRIGAWLKRHRAKRTCRGAAKCSNIAAERERSEEEVGV